MFMQLFPQLFAVELPVDEEDEEVDVDLGLAEHHHDGNALVLQLQQVLKEQQVIITPLFTLVSVLLGLGIYISRGSSTLCRFV